MSTAVADARRQCLQSFYKFNHYVMGYPDIDTAFHRELCATRQSWRYHPITLHLEPRGHLKTSILTIGDSCYEICLNPNIRIAIFNSQYATGRRIVRDIRTHYTSNARMRLLFPDLCIPKDQRKTWGAKWGDEAFEIPSRTISGESTVTLVSVQGSAVSMHFDLLNFDDMLDHRHVTTQEIRDKHFEWFLGTFPLRHDPSKSRIRQEGTFYHHDDTYSRQIKREQEYRLSHPGLKNLLVHRSSVWRPNGTPTWPERYSPEAIEKLREEHRTANGSEYIFNCQYLLDPTPAEQAILKWKQVRRIAETDIEEPYANYVSVHYRTDPNDGRCDVILLCSVDAAGNIYIRRIWTGQFTPSDLISNLVYLSKAYQLDSVFISSPVYVNVIEPAVEYLDKYKHDWIPFQEVDRPETTKVGRILALQPAVKEGRIFAIEGLDNVVSLREEFEQMSALGSMGHDVILQCLAEFARFAGRPHRPEVKHPIPGTYGAMFPYEQNTRQRNYRAWNPLDTLVRQR